MLPRARIAGNKTSCSAYLVSLPVFVGILRQRYLGHSGRRGLGQARFFGQIRRGILGKRVGTGGFCGRGSMGDGFISMNGYVFVAKHDLRMFFSGLFRIGEGRAGGRECHAFYKNNKRSCATSPRWQNCPTDGRGHKFPIDLKKSCDQCSKNTFRNRNLTNVGATLFGKSEYGDRLGEPLPAQVDRKEGAMAVQKAIAPLSSLFAGRGAGLIHRL